ncbi:MAG: WYL domain-containing protein [Muribaculaceae bacterium]|nr:WYL domain-containing protein [Muribaculaceae bacterium]
MTKHARLKKAKIRFTAFREQADYILTKPLHSSQQLVYPRRADGSMDFEIEVVINYELIKRFLSFGDAIKVLSPKSLVEDLVSIYKIASVFINKISLFDCDV